METPIAGSRNLIIGSPNDHPGEPGLHGLYRSIINSDYMNVQKLVWFFFLTGQWPLVCVKILIARHLNHICIPGLKITGPEAGLHTS